MSQPTNSWSCRVQLLSPYAEKDNESSSSLDPLFDAEGASRPLTPMFSAGRHSLVTLFGTI